MGLHAFTRVHIASAVALCGNICLSLSIAEFREARTKLKMYPKQPPLKQNSVI